MSLADRMVVLNRGRIEQAAAARDVYDAPASVFVAGFVGTTNLIKGRLAQDGAGAFSFHLAGGTWALGSARPWSRPGAALLSARPEQIRLAAADRPGLAATVEVVLPLGPTTMVEAAVTGGGRLKIAVAPGAHEAVPLPGAAVSIGLVPGAAPAVFADDSAHPE